MVQVVFSARAENRNTPFSCPPYIALTGGAQVSPSSS
jgi:hypothetical protein